MKMLKNSIAVGISTLLLILAASSANALALPSYDCALYDPVHHASKTFSYQMMLKSQQFILGKIDLRITDLTGGNIHIGLYQAGVQAGPYASFYAQGTQARFGATLARDKDYVAIVQCDLKTQH